MECIDTVCTSTNYYCKINSKGIDSDQLDGEGFDDRNRSAKGKGEVNTFAIISTATRRTSQEDDRWREVPHSGNSVARSVAEDDQQMDEQTSSIQNVFGKLHSNTKAHALDRASSTARSIRRVREDLLPAMPCSNDSGDILDNTGQHTEVSGTRSVRRRSTDHSSHEGAIGCVPCELSDTSDDERHSTLEQNIREGTSVACRGDRDDVRTRSAYLRHDSTRNCRSRSTEECADDNCSSRQNVHDGEAIHAVAATQCLPDRRDDLTSESFEESEPNVSANRIKFGLRTKQDIANNSRDADFNQRQSGTSKFTSRRIAPHGRERSLNGKHPELLATCGCRHVDEVPRLGQSLSGSPRRDAFSRRLVNELFSVAH